MAHELRACGGDCPHCQQERSEQLGRKGIEAMSDEGTTHDLLLVSIERLDCLKRHGHIKPSMAFDAFELNLNAALAESEAAGREIARLRFMLQYALDAPDDPQAIKSILFDTLHGCRGAENVAEIRAAFGSYEQVD